ncbi:MAG: lytic transglycosylase domain-containing protein [Chlorobi bacterium]|nr:lytic transglycosylase domain-containing protein [Chlorobiota bacterium]
MKILLVAFAVVGISTLFIYAGKMYRYDIRKYNALRDSTYSVYALPIPDSVTFAGEHVPLEYFDVREALDKELHKITYWHSQTFLYLKRAHRYFPVIEKILEKNGIPDDFKYLAVTESGLTNIVSPSGAAGFWQIMKKTGQSYGLEINKEIDERYNLEKASETACKYLNDMHRKYKNWALAAAAYNAGQGNLDKQLKRQKAESYYDLLLNTETARYVFRIIAFKIIMENPQNFGFKFRKRDLYPEIPYKTVILDSAVNNFADYAEQFETNYKMLKFFNPWIRDSFITNKNNKKYTIKIPAKGCRSEDYSKNIENPDSIINNINF